MYFPSLTVVVEHDLELSLVAVSLPLRLKGQSIIDQL